jgi:hypothetical protein
VFNSSVDKLSERLASQRTAPELTILLSTYLLGRGNLRVSSLYSQISRYHQLASISKVDDLGILVNIMEGRIPNLFYSTHVDDIQRLRLRKHAGQWCNGLILQLLQITHRQWTFRSGIVPHSSPAACSG